MNTLQRTRFQECSACKRQLQSLPCKLQPWAAANTADLLLFNETAFSAGNCSSVCCCLVFFPQWALIRWIELLRASSCLSALPAHSLLLQAAFCQAAQQSWQIWQSLNAKSPFHNIPKIHVSNEENDTCIKCGSFLSALLQWRLQALCFFLLW